MKATDEFINQRAEDAYKVNTHPLSYKQIFAIGYKTAERDFEAKLQQKLIDLIATEQTGLSPEQVEQLKKGIENIGIPKKTFKSKVVEMGRRKIITGEKEIVTPKIIAP